MGVGIVAPTHYSCARDIVWEEVAEPVYVVGCCPSLFAMSVQAVNCDDTRRQSVEVDQDGGSGYSITGFVPSATTLSPKADCSTADSFVLAFTVVGRIAWFTSSATRRDYSSIIPPLFPSCRGGGPEAWIEKTSRRICSDVATCCRHERYGFVIICGRSGQRLKIEAVP